MGGDPPHLKVTGGFPRPGGAATDGAVAMAEVGQKVGVHLGRGGERGGGVSAYGNLHSKKAEYGHRVYCNAKILDMCEAVERKQGAWVEMRWREQAGLDMGG